MLNVQGQSTASLSSTIQLPVSKLVRQHRTVYLVNSDRLNIHFWNFEQQRNKLVENAFIRRFRSELQSAAIFRFRHVAQVEKGMIFDIVQNAFRPEEITCIRVRKRNILSIL